MNGAVVEATKKRPRQRPASLPPARAPGLTVSRLRAAERSRTLSQHLRVFDEHTRSEIKRKRLDALEQDNWQLDRRKDDDDDDDDYNPLEAPSSGEGATPAPDRPCTVRGCS